ncbi:hypothetical protein HYY74_02120 [Candidatus Woesearchaeota archaeon]|nr:hypothetical protein [Candidatus Woesearchaeota archaeon]
MQLSQVENCRGRVVTQGNPTRVRDKTFVLTEGNTSVYVTWDVGFRWGPPNYQEHPARAALEESRVKGEQVNVFGVCRKDNGIDAELLEHNGVLYTPKL